MAADPGKAKAAGPPSADPVEPRVTEPPARPSRGPAEPRSAEQIREEISDEREGLTRSLSDLREGVHSARRIPMIVGGALLAGVAAFAAFRAVRGDD